jgi:hypothetical protein
VAPTRAARGAAGGVGVLSRARRLMLVLQQAPPCSLEFTARFVRIECPMRVAAVALLLLTLTGWSSFAPPATGQVEKYDVDMDVDCDTFCSPNFTMHFVCAIGFNFSGACVLPDSDPPSAERGGTPPRLCRLVGICSGTRAPSTPAR